jgi:hypothetical protein
MVLDTRMKVVNSYHSFGCGVVNYFSSLIDISALFSHHKICHKQDHNYESLQKFKKLHDVIYQVIPLPSIHDSCYRCYLLC